jgi:hypothetical protein
MIFGSPFMIAQSSTATSITQGQEVKAILNFQFNNALIHDRAVFSTDCGIDLDRDRSLTDGHRARIGRTNEL